MTRRQKIQKETMETVAPILGGMGIELVDVEYTHRHRQQVLCLYLDREGGITVDELQAASHAVERALEVADVVPGSYRLEVSSPGIDRPWKRPEDFMKNIGARLILRSFTPLAGSMRRVKATLVDVGQQNILIETDEGQRLTVPFDNIASARPEVDWEQLLKGPAGPTLKVARARRSS